MHQDQDEYWEGQICGHLEEVERALGILFGMCCNRRYNNVQRMVHVTALVTAAESLREIIQAGAVNHLKRWVR